MFKEFKTFLLRGNVVDLAIGVVIGAAFGSVVTALVSDILTPLIAAIAKTPDFGALAFTVNGSRFALGHFINAVFSFLLVAASIFFFVIKPMNALFRRFNKNNPVEAKTKPCPECLGEIPVKAKRCQHCGQIVIN